MSIDPSTAFPPATRHPDMKIFSLVSEFEQKCREIDNTVALTLDDEEMRFADLDRLENRIIKSRARTIEGLVEKAIATAAFDGFAYYERIAASIVRDLIAMAASDC